MGKSIKERLLDLSRSKETDVNLLYIRYLNERFLYRLGASEYRNWFALKGGMLLLTKLEDEVFRTTKDLDFHGFNKMGQEEAISIFTAIARIDCDDGVCFDSKTLKIGEIKGQTYGKGYTLEMRAHFKQAEKISLPLRIDVGFSDVVFPSAENICYNVLLDGMPEPNIKAYNKYTVIAEKFHAMVRLGELNSRMKDFFDVLVLLSSERFEGEILAGALSATFKARQTSFKKELPLSLREEFFLMPKKERQWIGFLRKIESKNKPEFREVGLGIIAFLKPIYLSIYKEEIFSCKWDSDARSWELITS